MAYNQDLYTDDEEEDYTSAEDSESDNNVVLDIEPTPDETVESASDEEENHDRDVERRNTTLLQIRNNLRHNLLPKPFGMDALNADYDLDCQDADYKSNPLELLYLQPPPDSLAYYDHTNGLLCFEVKLTGAKRFGERVFSFSVKAYNSEWRLVIPYDKWHVGLFVECKNRDNNALYLNYSCLVEFSAVAGLFQRKVVKQCYHVYDKSGDFGFREFDESNRDYPKLCKASVKIFEKAPCGLLNSTTLCYMNVILQSLFALTEFRRLILSVDVDNECLRNLQKLFIAMQYGSDAGDPSDVFFSTNWAKQENSFMQQDIQEFYLNFLDEIEKALEPVGLDVKMKELFQGIATRYTESLCPDVKYKSEKADGFYNLTLTMQSPDDDDDLIDEMDDAIQQYVKPEILDGDNCLDIPEHGKQSVKIGSRFSHLPPILSIYIMRTKYDPIRGLVKIHDSFFFPLELDMTPYIDCEDKEEYKYVLKSLITHRGTGSEGHYTAFLASKCDPSNLWYLMNDNKVELRSSKDLDSDECLSSCMFFYIKKRMVAELMYPVPSVMNISPHLKPDLEKYLIIVEFSMMNQNNEKLESGPKYETIITTQDIFELNHEWLFAQASKHFGLAIDDFQLFVQENLVMDVFVPIEVFCTGQPLADLPIYKKRLQCSISRNLNC